MTLRQLLKPYGINNYRDLRDRADLSRQYAWMLWNGTADVSLEVARKIKEATGLPLDEILEARQKANHKRTKEER
jgi:transcriptional regulator with XRE-family HTH domain